MLAEGAEDIQSVFVDDEQDLGHSFCDSFFKLSHYFENIVLPKYLIHSDYDLPINDKNVSLVGCMQTIYVLLVDPQRFQRKNEDIEQNVIHSLGVLDT